jgi:hypothetical protein
VKPAVYVALLALTGFAIGFAWGRGTRDAMPGATSTEFAGGVLTVRVDARQALGNGLAGLLG